MTAKTSTFAGQLKHFAQSVDIVDSKVFDQVRDLVCKYVTNELKGEYFELLREETMGNGHKQQWLRTFWSSEEKRHGWLLAPDADGAPSPLVEVATHGRPMWLVSPEKKQLDQTDTYVDLWSGTEHVSAYRPSAGDPIRTAIVVPLDFQRSFGVYCIESSQYIEITEVAKSELRRLADALAILYRLWDLNKTQTSCTEHAIGDLRDLLDHARFPKLAKPHMFVAYSSRADETVKLTIRDVLDQFKDKLEFTDWAEMYASGDISRQIGRDILGSRFGICYLSEPAEAPEPGVPTRYRDNSNVVFEAGMLHARTAAASDQDSDKAAGEPSGWIPIRERLSPPAPFDFAAERILVVPRSHNGMLNESRFRDLLVSRIEALISES